jgi:hypothetical protein
MDVTRWRPKRRGVPRSLQSRQPRGSDGKRFRYCGPRAWIVLREGDDRMPTSRIDRAQVDPKPCPDMDVGCVRFVLSLLECSCDLVGKQIETSH